MIIRIQTEYGMKRVDVNLSDATEELYGKVASLLEVKKNGLHLYKDRSMAKEIRKSRKDSLKNLFLSNGDILYARLVSKHQSMSIANASLTASQNVGPQDKTAEDEVDLLLKRETGLIHRNRHPQLCTHSVQGKCLHCSPLEPFDEDYLKSLNPPAKHMSFHGYLKKLKSGANKDKYIALENVSCKIKPGCNEHAPWPKGVCTKCQPSAVMLNRQTYRHVDNILFESPIIMDRFLDYWRKTGCQRLGFLYGRYEKHENVPLGIRATVSFIYEPPQDSTRDSIKLLDDSNIKAVEAITSNLGIVKVGWIVTDLIADEQESGKVKCIRDKDSHFLSAQECITAAYFQNEHPNMCQESRTKRFGSKFVTVVVSGHKDKDIHYDGWQVSNQCMALVRDECLVPTIDDPALGYIKESSVEQFVPDVFYKEKDEYGNEITKISRPMPIEYFLIEVPVGFPLTPVNRFVGKINDPFPIENRVFVDEIQNFESLMKYIKSVTTGGSFSIEEFSDIHFLLFLMTNDMIPLRDKIIQLCKIIRANDNVLFHQWIESEEWKTVEQMIAAHGLPNSPSSSNNYKTSSDHSPDNIEAMDTSGVGSSATWTCRHCTFINLLTQDSCEMCSLPNG